MYVRWKKRPLHKQRITGWTWVAVNDQWRSKAVRISEPTGAYALSAQLVESRRVDGKPRQSVIKYLGTITDTKIGYVGHRMGFWRTVGAALAALALPADQQRQIEQALAQRVPFPTPDEIQQERERFAQLEARLRQR